MQVSHLCALSRLGSLESKGVFEDVTGIESIVNAGAGHWHSLAVSKKGNVYAWGSNKHMQLGVPATALEGGAKGAAKPQMLAALRDAGVKQVACGALHSMAVTRDGELYTWGYGKHGRLGHGDEEDQMLPKRVEALRGEKINAAFAGFDVSAAVSMAGKAWLWGQGFFYQLGQDDNKDRLLPTSLDVSHSIRQLAFGAQHSAAGTNSHKSFLSTLILPRYYGTDFPDVFPFAAVGHTGVLLTWGNSERGVLGQVPLAALISFAPRALRCARWALALAYCPLCTNAQTNCRTPLPLPEWPLISSFAPKGEREREREREREGLCYGTMSVTERSRARPGDREQAADLRCACEDGKWGVLTDATRRVTRPRLL